jgi:hypothetical protein
MTFWSALRRIGSVVVAILALLAVIASFYQQSTSGSAPTEATPAGTAVAAPPSTRGL